MQPNFQDYKTEYGNYELLECIGAGGMGKVFRARHKLLGRIDAVKVISDPLLAEREVVQRFLREARLLSTLVHPNIVRFNSFGLTDDGKPFFSMEYCKGTQLEDFLNRCSFDRDEVARIAVEVCAGLAYAHSQGILHRDLKPSNVLVLHDKTVKLIDFGLACASEPGEGQALTRESVMLGTPAYCSPEKCCGQRADFRSDIYSLGCLLYFMVFGQPPFDGAAEKIMREQRSKQPPFRSELSPSAPEGLTNIIKKAMEKDPRKRFQSVLELQHELEDFYAKRNSPSKLAGARKLKPDWPLIVTLTAIISLCGLVLYCADLFGRTSAAMEIAHNPIRRGSQSSKGLQNSIRAADELMRRGKFEQAYSILSGLTTRMEFDASSRTDFARVLIAKAGCLRYLGRREQALGTLRLADRSIASQSSSVETGLIYLNLADELGSLKASADPYYAKAFAELVGRDDYAAAHCAQGRAVSCALEDSRAAEDSLRQSIELLWKEQCRNPSERRINELQKNWLALSLLFKRTHEEDLFRYAVFKADQLVSKEKPPLDEKSLPGFLPFHSGRSKWLS